MNIFYLSFKPKRCARYHVDRHVVKMILETCQLLCSALWMINTEEELKENPPVCKLTHKNHPSAIWARANKNNWLWLQQLGIALCEEYTFRYEKKHKLEDAIRSMIVPGLVDEPFFPPTQAMPDEYKCESSKKAYRAYYIKGKAHLHYWKNRHAWKKRNIPKFIRLELGLKKD